MFIPPPQKKCLKEKNVRPTMLTPRSKPGKPSPDLGNSHHRVERVQSVVRKSNQVLMDSDHGLQQGTRFKIVHSNTTRNLERQLGLARTLE